MKYALALVFALAGCTGADPVERAESDLSFIQAHGATKEEVCEAERAVAEAYRKVQNADGYERAKLSAQIACRAADQAA